MWLTPGRVSGRKILCFNTLYEHYCRRNDMKRKSNPIRKRFVHNDIIVDTPNDIANCFNEYFINIGSQLAESLTTNVNFDHYLQNTYNHVAIKFNMIDEAKILSIKKIETYI